MRWVSGSIWKMATLSAKCAKVVVLCSSPRGGILPPRGHCATSVPLCVAPGVTPWGHGSIVIGMVVCCYHCVPFCHRRSIVFLRGDAEGNIFRFCWPMQFRGSGNQAPPWVRLPDEVFDETRFFVDRGPLAMGPNFWTELILATKMCFFGLCIVCVWIWSCFLISVTSHAIAWPR